MEFEENIKDPLIIHRGKINEWEDLKVLLPSQLRDDKGQLELIRGYFEIQKLIKEGEVDQARENVEKLDSNKDYRKLEDSNPEILAAVDVLTRGRSNLVSHYKVKPRLIYLPLAE